MSQFELCACKPVLMIVSLLKIHLFWEEIMYRGTKMRRTIRTMILAAATLGLAMALGPLLSPALARVVCETDSAGVKHCFDYQPQPTPGGTVGPIIVDDPPIHGRRTKGHAKRAHGGGDGGGAARMGGGGGGRTK